MGVNEMGTIIRSARGKMSQFELADLAKVSQGWVSKIESGGIGNPDPAKITRVALALDIDERTLFAAQHGIDRTPGVSANVYSPDHVVRGVPNSRVREIWNEVGLSADMTSGELIMLRHHLRAIRDSTVALRELYGEDVAAFLASAEAERRGA